MLGTRRRRRRRQFLSRDLDQDCWEPWSVSNRLNNANSELPFLRPLGTVESFLLDWQTCLVCSPQECSGVGDFDKAKRLDAHALCWKWCSNVTDLRKRRSGVRSLTPPMVVSPGCSLLFGQLLRKSPFVINLSCPFKDVNCEAVVVVRSSQEWLSHRLLYCFHGWHESRVWHTDTRQNGTATQRA